jgi:hypothetical protein
MMKKLYKLSIAMLCIGILAYADTRAQEGDPSGAKMEVKNSCADCHGKMAGKLGKPVTEWKKSVHVLQGNDCNMCHGGNPKISDKKLSKSPRYNFIGKPDKRIITDFCGRGGCHRPALEQFKRGPHYISVLKTNQPNCTSCHGTHNIQRSSVDVITVEKCTGCHPAQYSRDIVKLIGDIEVKINAIDKDIQFLVNKRVDVAEQQKDLNDTRHLFHQLVHVFSRDEMQSTKKILELQIHKVAEETTDKTALIKRLDYLSRAMIIFGLMIIVGISAYTIVMYGKRRK